MALDDVASAVAPRFSKSTRVLGYKGSARGPFRAEALELIRVEQDLRMNSVLSPMGAILSYMVVCFRGPCGSQACGSPYLASIQPFRLATTLDM
jgi:hypothetical protein